MITERLCPVCKGCTFTPFADERIDPEKIGALTYASRKPPEFMCLRLVCCKTCDLVYAPSPPSEGFLKAAYTDSGFDSGVEAIEAAETYADALEPHLIEFSGRYAAVEVGAGSGAFLPWLQSQRFKPVIGIEPSCSAIDAATIETQKLLRKGMFSASRLKEERVSLVCSFMTLEHLHDPSEFASSVYDLLESGGALAVVVHNWRAPINRLLGTRSPVIDIEHMQLFSPDALSELLKRAGFEHIKLEPIRNSYSMRYWIRLTPLPKKIKQLILNIFERLGLADRKITVNVGNILAVGIKKVN